MAITSLAGRYLQDSFKFVTQNSQSAVSPDKWIFADGEGVPITWIDVTASWAASASVAVGLVDNIWVRSTGSNSAVLNDSGSRISVAYGTSSIAYGHRTTASGDFSQAQGSSSWAYGTGSHAGGLHTIACGSYQTVVGRFNKPNNDSDYFVIGDGTTNANRSDALGVNATRFFASNSIYFPDLADQRYQHIVMFNTESGQINYYTASGLGGGGTTLPGGPHGAIQFNSASTFSGSNYFVYNYQNSQLGLTGSQIIDLSGSATALQIINDCSGQSSTLTGLPFIHTGIRNSYVGNGLTGVWVPSGSYGQYWSLAYSYATYIYDITSSNGDLQFRGALGKSTGANPADSRTSNSGIYASAIDKILIPFGKFGVINRNSQTTVYAYSSSVIASQPLGFTASYTTDLSYYNSLHSYTASLIASDGSGISNSNIYGVAAPAEQGGPFYKFAYTPSASINYYTFAAQYSASKGDANYVYIPGTPFSASYAAWLAAGANTFTLESVGDTVPIGFFMSTFEQGTTVTQSVEISTDISASGIHTSRFVQYRPGLSPVGASTSAPLYNPITNRIYVLVKLVGAKFTPPVIPSDTLAIVELDNSTSPPTVTNVSDMYGGTVSMLNSSYFKGWAINTDTGDIIIASFVNVATTRFDVYDANTLNIAFNNSAARKATYTMPFYSPMGTITHASNSFYMVGTVYNGVPNSSNQLQFLRIDSSSAGYAFVSNSYETTYHSNTTGVVSGTGIHAYAASIDKVITTNMSDVGPVGDPLTADEVPPLTFASAHKVYTLDTGSLDLSATFSPYSLTVSRVGNFVEFIDCAGEVLSYVDANGVFQGTASFASNVLPGGSSIEFYSGSVLQTSNLEGLVISGSYLQSQANGNQVTMSIDLSSILATFTSQSFTTPATSWTFNHNLNERHPLITVYDNNHEVIIPQDVIANNNNTVTINFSANTTGYAVAGAGPFTGLTRYPISFYSSSVLQTSDLRSLVISGSGVTSTLNGNQITMSFSGGGGGTANPGGANTNIQFNYNGNSLSGSGTFTFISQSSTVLLTGSLIITGSGSSPSLNVTGTSLLTGSLNLSGSATITSGTITAITPVVGGEGFIGTASWATNASNVTVTGDTSFDRDWNLTFTRYTGVPTAVENRNLYADPQLEYNTKYNQLLINATGSKINQQTGSNIAVNNIQPAGNSIQIGSSRSGSVYYVNLSSSLYNNNVYGLIMNYTITADHTLVNNHNAEDHNEDPSTGGIPYVETGTITVTWTGRDSDYNISTATFDTDPAAYYTIVTPLPTEWRLQSGTTYGEIDADELYSYAPKYTTYRHDTDLQFGYKLVNNNSPSGVTTGEWYFEIMLWNALPARVEFISNTNLLTYNQSL